MEFVFFFESWPCLGFLHIFFSHMVSHSFISVFPSFFLHESWFAVSFISQFPSVPSQIIFLFFHFLFSSFLSRVIFTVPSFPYFFPFLQVLWITFLHISVFFISFVNHASRFLHFLDSFIFFHGFKVSCFFNFLFPSFPSRFMAPVSCSLFPSLPSGDIVSTSFISLSPSASFIPFSWVMCLFFRLLFLHSCVMVYSAFTSFNAITASFSHVVYRIFSCFSLPRMFLFCYLLLYTALLRVITVVHTALYHFSALAISLWFTFINRSSATLYSSLQDAGGVYTFVYSSDK